MAINSWNWVWTKGFNCLYTDPIVVGEWLFSAHYNHNNNNQRGSVSLCSNHPWGLILLLWIIINISVQYGLVSHVLYPPCLHISVSWIILVKGVLVGRTFPGVAASNAKVRAHENAVCVQLFLSCRDNKGWQCNCRRGGMYALRVHHASISMLLRNCVPVLSHELCLRGSSCEYVDWTREGRATILRVCPKMEEGYWIRICQYEGGFLLFSRHAIMHNWNGIIITPFMYWKVC